MALRWGIVSVGKISFDFCVALGTLNPAEHTISAVGARDKARAVQFAKEFDIPHAFGSYEELAKSPDVDVIYIGNLNHMHLEVGLLMLDHGKHILCEKPLCMNLKEAKQLIQRAQEKKLFLMEAVWPRFFPSYQYVRQQIQSGALGEIQHVDVCFGFEMNDVGRLQKKDMGGGASIDLGIYTIQLSQWAFQEKPLKVVAKGEKNKEDVDIYVEAELHYSGGRKSIMTLSAKATLENKAVIKGSKGTIVIPGFWSPTTVIDVNGEVKEWPLPPGRYPTKYINSVGLRYEADAVRKNILEGKLQNDIVTHEDSLFFAQIEDEIRNQLGATLG